MDVDILAVLVLIAVLVLVNILSVIALFAGKHWFRARYLLQADFREGFHGYLGGGSLPILPKRHFKVYLLEYSRLCDEIVVPSELKDAVFLEFRARGLDKKWQKALVSGRATSRMEAASILSLFGDEASVSLLMERMETEKSLLIRLRIAHALVRSNAVQAIPVICRTLTGGKAWYRYRLIEIVLGFGSDLREYLEERLDAGDPAVLPLVLSFGRRFINPTILEHLVKAVHSGGEFALQAAKILAERYPEYLNEATFLGHSDPEIRSLAWASLARIPNAETLGRLLGTLGDKEISRRITEAIGDVLRRTPSLLPSVMSAFRAAVPVDPIRADALSDVLASRLDYFIYGGQPVNELLAFLITRKRLATLDSFFHSNRNAKIEETLVDLLQAIIRARPALAMALASGLNATILEKLGIPAAPQPKKRNHLKISVTQKLFLWILAAFCILFPIGAFALFRFVPGEGGLSFISRYVLFYNYMFAYYSIAINSIYFILLVMSIFGLVRQLRIWAQARASFLLADRMLPPVSLIVPAFREENSIVDSVRSLLSLDYSQVEIIVVCDGSPDATLSRITDAFSMERSDVLPPAVLPSAPVRGVYRSEKYPYLVVLDKVNGGKADALNAGINFARHDYLCCVDADSLLESDSLLKIMYQVVSTDKELVACGGNILPVNGCSVRMGAIEKYAPPKNPLARFQTVEYLRAFLAGRMGWAYLNSLLVISGAFGVFRRDRVIEIGGYLTGEGTGKLDTVGEDMELVVRLARHMREKKLRFKIGYAFNANCWTEVPEDFGSLNRQRNRWHRGLIEILLYHRKCAFNPRYGLLGLVGFPYYWIFELAGPFLETAGWLAAIIAGVMGFLNPSVLLLLFASTIVFGTAISTASLAIGEFRVMYYSPRETIKLLVFSILENFGFRQVMSIARVFAYFSILLGSRGWGLMKRKGFSS